jgi:trimethylamine:corrinoid methyltransferase-like protein
LKHMREIFVPQFMDRRPYNVWEEKRDDGRDWSLEKARKILNTYQPEPLDSALTAELKNIIASIKVE